MDGTKLKMKMGLTAEPIDVYPMVPLRYCLLDGYEISNEYEVQY